MKKHLVFACAMCVVLALAGVSAGAGVCSAGGDAAATPDAAAGTLSGTVVATMNASRYTYVQIDTGREKVWAAGPIATIQVGDRVSVATTLPNPNFYSPTLKKTFDLLYFVEAFTPVTGGASVTAGASACSGAMCTNGVCPSGTCTNGACPKDAACSMASVKPVAAPAAAVSFDGIQKPAGGKTVAEVWAEKGALAGKPVVVQAKAVKVVSNILGKNFVHLRDGTGAEGANDLTVTTRDNVKVQSIVTASGTLTTDKDFGAGYRYDVILEDATVVAK